MTPRRLLVILAAAVVAGVGGALAAAAAADAWGDHGASILVALVAVWVSQGIPALIHTRRTR